MSEPCIKCGEPTENIIEFSILGSDPANVHVCEACFDSGQRGIEPWHRRFRVLIANGVSRKRANEILIAMMDREKARR